MFRFFLKKSFYDGWDNLFTLALFNASALAIAAIGIWVPSTVDSVVLRLAGLVFSVFAGSVWWSVTAHAMTKVADFKTVRLAEVREALVRGFVPGLQVGAVVGLSAMLASVVFPFYASIDSFFGLFTTSLAFWIFLCFGLILQYVLPWRAVNGGTFREAMHSSLILFMDAPLFSLALALDGILCIVLSPLVAFLLPGPAAAVLTACEGARLRTFRLRWLASPDSAKAKTPWAVLLASDAEALGERDLKHLFFPWAR